MRVPLSVLIFHLAVAKDHDHLFAGRAVSGKLLSYLMEQSRSARILVQSAARFGGPFGLPDRPFLNRLPLGGFRYPVLI